MPYQLEQEEPILETINVTKVFLDVKAVDRINLKIFKNEILGIFGENGAGKTTLMKILYGLYRPDEGRIRINGQEAQINSPQAALKYGIGMVHQHFNLVENHTVLENIITGIKVKTPFGIIKYNHFRQVIRQLSEKHNLNVNPDALINQLSVGEKQRVEILKILYREAKILILDEPTAVLTPHEVQAFFKSVKQLKSQGLSIIFITHKISELLDITDRVVVLRNGQIVDERRTEAGIEKELAQIMVGSDEKISSISLPNKQQKKVSINESKYNFQYLYKIENIEVRDDLGLIAVNKITLTLKEGTILGIAGVSGNGQRELAEALAGVRQIVSGTVLFEGKEITNMRPQQLISNRIARIPEDRMRLGLILDLNIAENLILETFQGRMFSRNVFLSWHTIMENAKHLISLFKIKAPGPKTIIKFLSGGNIQKILLARELNLAPRIILASQPTRGLDVKSTNYIHKIFLKQREMGCGILLISGDLDELFKMCDEICVIFKGRIVGHVNSHEASKWEIGKLMMGLK